MGNVPKSKDHDKMSRVIKNTRFDSVIETRLSEPIGTASVTTI